MLKKLSAIMKDEKGQALAEYGLILALIAVICVGALTLLGGNVSTTLTNIAGKILP
ncbi:Flp family type IVb pilin [Candidatus Deferrimicrobium sp.]|uniref:Flp family type IVb pilin n=1 Tax=Candidatus Deferrimicrobium sp. TaxID=3060586 RepID=UPI002716EB94|nr:Flp family type IVb pilin [Candidatus Deferrimicrobium sp.]MDO8737593.1 Flp family type IVb pilin [Candidatus Deferrimicrobium sp.]